MDRQQKVDEASLAKLLAWFEAAGCKGAVLAGTNGEGPSLSATEKRDLIDCASGMRGKLDLILGIATPSIEEASWLCRRAADSNAAAVLVMPPGYFREVSEEAIGAWFQAILDRSPIPVIVYNFPQRTGITLSAPLLQRLGKHSNMAGAKDSSGERANLAGYRNALDQDKSLFVGNETLLVEALEQGWSGTISGAANSVPLWLSQIVSNYFENEKESAEAKFRILLPVLEAIRKSPQPAGHKAVLKAYSVLQESTVRLPLNDCTDQTRDSLLKEIEKSTGYSLGL